MTESKLIESVAEAIWLQYMTDGDKYEMARAACQEMLRQQLEWACSNMAYVDAQDLVERFARAEPYDRSH